MSHKSLELLRRAQELIARNDSLTAESLQTIEDINAYLKGATTVAPPLHECFTVYCSTGCSCCSNENHERGPFFYKSEAEKACEYYSSITLLASQYASRGRYEIRTHKFEQLPDGRLIIDGEKVCAGFITDPMADPIYEGSYW